MLSSAKTIRLRVNGKAVAVDDAPADMHLAHFLRESLDLTGTRLGCSIGECRACTVMVRHDDQSVPITKQACMVPLRHVDGWEITTIEGLSGDSLHPVQEAILQSNAMQCGFCAAGFAVAGAVAYEHVRANPMLDPEVVVEAIAGQNLCRCTGYSRYIDAIVSAVQPLAVSVTQDGGGLHTSGAMPVPSPQPGGYVALFEDPQIELIRLLRGAAEIEHSLCVQYLYAVFSIKTPQYMSLAGWPSHRYGGRPLHLFGVAIEEMVHLDMVNQFLGALGAAPHLGRQQLPYENDIYPFPFLLEPLSLSSIAKYTYVEASGASIDPSSQSTPEDKAFVEKLLRILGIADNAVRPNQIGSLYRKIEDVLGQLRARRPTLINYDYWQQRMSEIMFEGEQEHFQLFRSLFEGTHATLHGPGVWDEAGEAYPALPLSATTGIPPSGTEVPFELAPALRHLSNLHYWAVCLLLQQSYSRGGRLHNAARRHMTGPLRSLGTALSLLHEGVPFDVLPTGYMFAASLDGNLDVARAFISEIGHAERRFRAFLPEDYSRGCARETAQELSSLAHQAHSSPPADNLPTPLGHLGRG